MDFEDLLDEVEQVIQKDQDAGRLHTNLPRSSLNPLNKGKTNSIDALLEMFTDNQQQQQPTTTTFKAREANPKPSIPDLSSRSADKYASSSLSAFDEADMASTSTTTSSSSSSTIGSKQQGATRKKCSQVMVSGTLTKRGTNTAVNAACACSNLRCNECDFNVLQFAGKQWNSTVDYMFFRENMPDERKLSVKLDVEPASVAYACQCKWLSVQSPTRVERHRVKWFCGGH